MLWRKSTSLIYVAYDNGSWAQFDDTWEEGRDPTYSCPDSSTPSSMPPTPLRGFGKIWCSEADVREGLGDALAYETADARSQQDLQSGWMVYIKELNAVYAFDQDALVWASSQ